MTLGPYVGPRGNHKARIMLVGEAPGAHEEREGKPFVGPAGRVLEECLLKAGIDPSDCWFTNLCKHRPPSNELEAWIPNGVPNETVLSGLESLSDEIERVNPNVIVPLGNWPLWAFYSEKSSGISTYRGYVLEARKLGAGRKLVPTFHPSYLLRGAFAEIPLAVFDLRRAAVQAASPVLRRRERVCYVDPRGAEREDLRRRLLTEGRWLSVDIEYAGSTLLAVGFAVSATWGVSIRIRSRDDVLWCQALIESGRPLLMQNGMFDCGILEWHYNMQVFKHLAFDTMVAAYNLNIEYPKDLGFLAGMYTDIHPWWENIDGKFWTDLKKGKRDADELLEYNCYDAMSTYEIAEGEDPELDSDLKLREAFEFDMRKIPHLWDVAKRGVRMDTTALETLRNTAIHDEDEAQTLLNEMVDALGMPRNGVDFNVKSGPQVVMFLTWIGVILTKRTETKQLATDSKTLMDAMRVASEQHHRKAIELILTVRRARDIQSKFTDIEWDEDGRSRCIYDPTKTVTRRLSSKKFFPTKKGTNLQNIAAPGSSEYGDPARGCFVADEGHEFGYSDLKGAEFLVVAELTQDPLMLKYAQMTVDGSGDVHRETASFIFSRIYNRPVDPYQLAKDSVERYLGKKTRHSGNYDVGWYELMLNINKEALKTGVWVDAKMSKQLLKIYTELHPGLPNWWDECRAEVRRTRKMRNLFGFVRRFNGDLSQACKDAIAFKPQSTIGDALNYGLCACAEDAELRDAGFQLLLQIHDAIGFQYPIDHKAFVLSRVRKLMDIPIPIPKTGKDLHIPVEIACGPSWGQTKVWEEDIKANV